MCLICTDPVWDRNGSIRILGRRSNQAVEVIHNAKSVRGLAKKSDKERLIQEDAQKRGVYQGRGRRRRRMRGAAADEVDIASA